MMSFQMFVWSRDASPLHFRVTSDFWQKIANKAMQELLFLVLLKLATTMVLQSTEFHVELLIITGHQISLACLMA